MNIRPDLYTVSIHRWTTFISFTLKFISSSPPDSKPHSRLYNIDCCKKNTTDLVFIFFCLKKCDLET